MKIKIKKIFFVAICFANMANAQNVFNDNLQKNERLLLSSGKTVIKNTSSYKKTCIESSEPCVQKALETLKMLKPAYLAEVIQIYPEKGNENFIEIFSRLVMDIPSYVGIPYFSERSQSWYDLYSSAEIVSTKTQNNFTFVKANLDMSPFGMINAEITTEKSKDFFYYEMTNISTLRYKDKFDCVSPGNMKSIIAVFKADGKWILYGLGAVKAPNIFFLRDRIEVSFMNRIKTFCTFFFEKL